MNAGDISITLSLDGRDMQLQLKNAGALLRVFESQVKSTGNAVKRLEDHHLSLATKFRNLVLTLGNLRFALLDIYDVFLRLPGQILTTSGELERIQQLMAGLSTKASADARKLEAALGFEYLIDRARNAPFALESLATSFVKLKTAGIDPTNGSMNALVDSVAKVGGTSENLTRAAVAIQQMAGKGVISMEELRQQLGEAVPEAMNAMAAGMGLTMAELTKQVSSGTVEANSAIGKMLTVLNIRNRGAAQEMMKTWVGTLAQLQTEWQVATDVIAKGGFAEEAKDAVRALTDAMKSSDFKRFATDFGNGLGQAVKAIVEIVRFVAQYKDEILLVTGGLIALKIANSALIPAFQRTKQLFQDAGVYVQRYRNELANQAESLKAVRLAELEGSYERQRVAAQTSASVIAQKQKELASLRAVNAQILTEQQAVNARLAAQAAAVPAGTARIFAPIDRESVRRLEQLNTQLQLNTAQLRNSQAEINRHTQAMRTSQAAAAATAGQMVALEAGLVRATVAQRAMQGVMRAGQFLWAAMGGWVGVITTAVTLGALAWLNYKNQVAEADARLRRLRQGVASQEDADVFQGKADRARAEISVLQADLALLERRLNNYPENNPARRNVEKEIADVKAAINAQNQILVVEAAKASAARQQQAEQLGSEELQQYNRQSQAQLEAIEDRFRRIETAGREEFIARKQAAEGNFAQLQAIAKEEQQFNVKVGSDRARALLEQIEQERQIVTRRRDLTTEGRNQILAQLNRAALDARKALADSLNLLKADPSLSVPGQGPLKTPIQRFIDQLEEDKARLDVTIAGLASESQQSNKVLEALAAFNQKASDGFAYKVKGERKNATKEQLDQARELVAITALYQSVNDQASAITNAARQIVPDYQAALRAIADPLGQSGSTTKLNQIDELTTKLKDLYAGIAEAEKVGGDTGQSRVQAALFEDRLRVLREQAAAIDIAGLNRQIIEENQSLAVEVLQTDRERAAEQIRIEREQINRRITMMRDLLAQSGLTAAQQQAILEALLKNQALRLKSLELSTRTPMQRMLDQWKDSAGQMQEATARWADRTVDAITTMVRTGKFSFSDLAESIITDLIRIQVQAAAVDILKYLGGNGGGSSLISTIAGFFGFANGGIMTAAGPAGLRKYAAGGIANSPQLALFGEGSMPEAYVPLPDGRTIPVTMKGGGQAPNVVVNLINQSGQPVRADAGQPRFDGKQMVLDVVLSAASQPGPFRDGMRAMMQR